jgi:hypothetical protein
MLEDRRPLHQRRPFRSFRKNGLRRTYCTGATVLLSAWTAHAQDGDADHLRQLAEAERIAGRVTAIHLVEAYHALGVSTVRAQTESPRAWAEAFCAHASREFTWNGVWRVIVYAPKEDHPAHTCRIPTSPDRLNLD